MYTIKNTTGGCGAKNPIPPGNPGDVLYLVSSGVAGAASNVLYTGSGNLYAANSVTTTNVFATRYYGDGGLLSNITAATFAQPLANLVVSNSVTTTNIFATREILTGTTGQTTLNVTGNVYVSNAMTTQNVYVNDTLNVLGAMTANAANATFFFDTFTIPYINTQVINVATSMTLSGNLSAPLANITTLNVNYLTVNSAVVYGTSTLNVYGVSNLSTTTVNGSLNVNGPLATLANLYVPGLATFANLSVSNLLVTGNLIVTATNVQTTNALVINNAGTATALKVTQNEPSLHTHNVAEFWDATTLAMVIDPEGNVAIHTVSSPGYALTVTDPVNFETLYIRGKSGVTNLNVNGNVYVSNAVTTTNVFATTVSASTQFSGPGTGLTGSAASLSVGGSAGSLSATLGLTSGGTGQTSAQTAMNALAGAVTSTQYLRGNGTNVVMSAIQAGDVPTLNQNTSGSAGSLSTTYTAGRILYGAGSGVPTTVSTLFYDSGNGRLGIGTTSPGSPLHVYSSQNAPTELRVENPNTGTGAVSQISFLTNDASGVGGRGGLGVFNSTYTSSGNYKASGTYLYNNGVGGITVSAENGSGSVYIVAGNAERMRITSAGNVGIGTTSPGSALSFGNPVVNKILTLWDGNGSDPVSTATNFYGFGINGGTLRYQVDSTGSQHLFYCGGTAYYRINSAGGANVSDKRFKSEVEPISNALATVQQLQGITFKMQDLEKRQMGFIAQDVADIVPEVVSYDEGCDSHFLSYDKLTALLCEAIKELSTENTALKARLDSLESRLAAAGI